MMTVYGSFSDTVKEIVGDFSQGQMIAVGVVALIALLIGFFIGGTIFLVVGVKKGTKKGVKEALSVLKKQAETDAEDRVNAVLKEKEESESRNAEQAAALLAAQEKLQEAEKVKEEAEKTKEEAEQAAFAAARSKEETEKNMRELEEQIRLMKERETEAESAAAERKKRIELLSKQEILAYAGGLDEYLPVSVYERGGGDLPDSCRVGICTFLLVYERKGMVKLVLRLHKETASALEKQFKLFSKAVFPKGGDWYKWILSSEITDLSVVSAAIRLAYKYVFLSNYKDKTHEINVAYANRDEMRINEAILKYKDLPDRDFAVASDAAAGEKAAYRLYGKKEMTEYARSLDVAYPVTIAESDGELSPNTFKVGDKSFMLAYEKDGVARMVFRLSEEAFALLKKKHPTADVSPFPKATGYHWYVAYIDETFTSNEDIEALIRNSCAHVHELYNKKK